MHYRLGVGILLRNKDHLVFAAQRSDLQDAWQMPQGGIEKGETAIDAMRRELKEETGVSNAVILQEHPFWLSYCFSKHHSQIQKWFCLQFQGQEEEIALGVEFSNWKWVHPSFLLENIVSFKQEVYQNVFKTFQEKL
jgi:putative (di)nucleoside polyphosphate hydrolase